MFSDSFLCMCASGANIALSFYRARAAASTTQQFFRKNDNV